jgi:RNA polymerase sigma-70 factor (ECF subfamily)
MNKKIRTEVTQALDDYYGNRLDREQAASQLYDHVYSELRKIAGGLMRHERVAHTLQPTALVHEAYLKLVGQSYQEQPSRAFFFGVAAKAMRQILVDHSRRHNAEKRGGNLCRVTMDDNLPDALGPSFEILELHEALEKMKTEDARMAQVVELRIFGGLLSREVAEVIGVSKRTVDGDWKVAKMWLGRELSEQESP